MLWLGSRTGTTERSQALKNFNISHDTLAGSQINKRFPHLNYTEDKWHAVYEPNSGTILADKCLKAVQVNAPDKPYVLDTNRTEILQQLLLRLTRI